MQTLALTSIVVFVAVAVVVLRRSGAANPYQEIRVQQWNGNSSLFQFINEPVVLKDSPCRRWPAASKWSQRYLANHIAGVVAKQQRSRTVFRHFAEYPTFDTDVPRHREVPLSGDDALNAIYHPSQNTYTYISGSLMDLPEVLQDDVDPDELMVTENGRQTNFWFAGADVIAHLHYDTSHNFHFQISGTKIITLFPPSAFASLRLFPCLHALYRHTQINIYQNGTNLHSAPDGTTGYQVVLQPGGVLYIPPYWLHTVRSETPTLSVNVWSWSRDFERMEEAFLLPIPFETDWDDATWWLAVRVYTHLIVDMTFGLKSCSNFIRRQRGTRFAATTTSYSTSSSSDTTSSAATSLPRGGHATYCPVDTLGLDTHMPSLSDSQIGSHSSAFSTQDTRKRSTTGPHMPSPPASQPANTPPSPNTQTSSHTSRLNLSGFPSSVPLSTRVRTLVSHTQQRAHDLSSRFRLLRDEHVRVMYVENYVEHLLFRALGDELAHDIPVVLHQCFG